MQMLEAMTELHGLLRGHRTAMDTALALNAPVDRVAAYQRFVKNHVLSVLDKIYPSLRRVIGPEVWTMLCERYFDEVPARDYELNAAAEGLAQFIENQAQRPRSLLTLFHAELAALEWAEFVAYVHEAEMPDAADKTRPLLNPTVQVLRFWYPVAEYLAEFRQWQKGQRPSAPVTPEKTGAAEIVFVLRHPKTHAYRYAVADEALLLAFKMAHDGLTVSDVVAQSQLSATDVEAVVQRAARLGLALIGREPSDPSRLR